MTSGSEITRRRPSCGSGRRLNISSIRSVTNQPPTTLAVASTIATNPITLVTPSSASPSTTIAPTITIPWMKFVPDMSGVCSIVGTFEITSKPRKIASTRIVSSMTSPRSVMQPPRPARRSRRRLP